MTLGRGPASSQDGAAAEFSADEVLHPGGPLPTAEVAVIAVGPAHPPIHEDPAPALFGRGLLYVAVWSLQLVSAVVVSPVLAHLLPPGEFGQLASAIALHQVLVVLAVMGLDQAGVLLRAQSGSDTPIRSLVASGLVLACLVTVVTAVTAPLWTTELGFTGATRIVIITIAWTPPAAGVQLIGVVLLSQDRLKAFSVTSLLSGIGAQVIGLSILAGTGSREASSYATGNLMALVLTLALGMTLVRPRWRGVVDFALTRRALALGVPLMVSSLAVYVLNAGDRLIIQRLLGAAEAGRYQIAYTVGNVAVLLLSMTSAVWIPRIAAVRDEGARWALIGSSRDGLMRLMTPVILGITLGAPLLLTIVAPASYQPGSLLVVVFLVALAGFPVLLGSSTGQALITLERTKALAGSAIVAAVVNIGLNIALVPLWGLAGAAAATVVAFTVQAVIHSLALPRQVVWPRTRWQVWLPALVAAAVSAATLWLPQSPASNAGRFVLAAACLPWLILELRRARGEGGQPKAKGRHAR